MTGFILILLLTVSSAQGLLFPWPKKPMRTAGLEEPTTLVIKVRNIWFSLEENRMLLYSPQCFLNQNWPEPQANLKLLKCTDKNFQLTQHPTRTLSLWLLGLQMKNCFTFIIKIFPQHPDLWNWLVCCSWARSLSPPCHLEQQSQSWVQGWVWEVIRMVEDLENRPIRSTGTPFRSLGTPGTPWEYCPLFSPHGTVGPAGSTWRKWAAGQLPGVAG